MFDKEYKSTSIFCDHKVILFLCSHHRLSYFIAYPDIFLYFCTPTKCPYSYCHKKKTNAINLVETKKQRKLKLSGAINAASVHSFTYNT